MKPIHFEIATYVMYVFTIILIATRYRNDRDYWYTLIGVGLCIPFEWFADKYWMFLDYDWGFVMLVDRLPLFMFFSWGWFFALPLIICLRLQKRIDSKPLWLRIVVLYVIFWFWDFFVEYSSTGYQYWVYHWPEEQMIGGILPWMIPFAVAVVNVCLYFGHKIALKYSTGKGWFQGFLIHVLTYYIVFGAHAAVGWPLIKILGIKAVFTQ